IIAAILKKYNKNLETFSLKVAGRGVDEQYFNQISDHLALKSHKLTFGEKEFEEIYEDAMQCMDVPVVDNSIFPTCYISKQAAKRVKVVLSGEGGDEYFFGYGRQRALSKMQNISKKLTIIDKLYFSLPRFKGKNKIFLSLFSLAKDPLSYYFMTMTPARDFLTKKEWAQAKAFVYNQVSNPIYFDRDLYLENDLLKKLDLATMRFGLEGRVPLLDQDVVAQSKNFIGEYLSSNQSKPFLKKILENYLPAELVYRPKTGFGINPAKFILSSPKFKA